MIHCDDGPYVRRDIAFRSEFDVFETFDGGGYSAVGIFAAAK